MKTTTPAAPRRRHAAEPVFDEDFSQFEQSSDRDLIGKQTPLF